MTQYAITQDNPITAHGTARELWPSVSFSTSGPRADWLAAQGAVEIRRDPPYDTETQYLQRVDPYLLDGQVYDREPVDRPVAPPEPRWQDFQVALLTDPALRDMKMIAKDAYPDLIPAWAVGLGQAATGQGAESFMTAWTLARQLPDPSTGDPLLPQALVDGIAALATAADLPDAFIAGLNPPPPVEEDPAAEP